MALESEYSINNQFPPNQNSPQEPMPAAQEDWPTEKVVRWLLDNGWDGIVSFFEERKIHGKGFLQLTISDLSKVPRSSLAYSEKRRLVHSIKKLQPHESNQSTDGSLDSFSGAHEQPGYQDPMQTRVVLQPRLVIPPRSSVSPLYGTARPLPPPSTLDSDYARIRPYIPERISSTPEQISKIMKTLNVPQIRPIGPSGRGRPIHHYMPGTPAIGVNSRFGQSNVPPERIHSPKSPRMSSGDQETNWKMTGLRVQQRQEHPQPQPQPPSSREQRIQVTTDSDTFFSLVVTDIKDAQHIKYLILKKIGLKGEPEQYSFFHENGNRHDVALLDSDLVHICRISDSSSKDRVLVRPLEIHYNSDRMSGDLSNGNQYQRQVYRHPQAQYSQSSYSAAEISPTQTNWPSGGYSDIHDPQRRQQNYMQPDRLSPHIGPNSLASPVSRLQILDPASGQESSHFVSEPQRYTNTTTTSPIEDTRDEYGCLDNSNSNNNNNNSNSSN
ncbi:hypothetical protein CLU79DRAFT_767924, partial [Phycomyces nitens]